MRLQHGSNQHPGEEVVPITCHQAGKTQSGQLLQDLPALDLALKIPESCKISPAADSAGSVGTGFTSIDWPGQRQRMSAAPAHHTSSSTNLRTRSAGAISLLTLSTALDTPLPSHLHTIRRRHTRLQLGIHAVMECCRSLLNITQGCCTNSINLNAAGRPALLDLLEDLHPCIRQQPTITSMFILTLLPPACCSCCARLV